MKNTTEIKNSVLMQLAENNTYSEQILKKECPQLFDKKPTEVDRMIEYTENINKFLKTLRNE